MPSGIRYSELDGVRAVAILAVIVFHLSGVLGAHRVEQGASGVDAFLILSGFLLAINLRREAPGQFLLRRLRAIGPTYWVVIAGFVVIAAVTSVPLEAHPVRAVLLHVTFLNALVVGDAYTLSDSWWFMGAIALMYVSFVPARPLVAKGRWGAVLLYGAALQAAALVLLDDVFSPSAQHAAFFGQLIVRSADFWFGAAVGTFAAWRRAGGRAAEPAWVVVAAVAAFGAVTGWFARDYTHFVAVHPLLLGLAVVAAGVALGRAVKAPVVPRAVAAAVAWLSAASFEIYLVHQPFISTFNDYGFARWLPSDLSSRARLAIGSAVGLVLTGLVVEGLRRIPWDTLITRVPARQARRVAVLAGASAVVAATAAAAAQSLPDRNATNAALRPVVVALQPREGPAGGAVAITGRRFDKAVKVLFGDRPAPFVVDGYEHISAEAPGPATTGTVDVRVVNALGTSAPSVVARYTYLPPAR